MKKLTGVLLLGLAIYLGYQGITMFSDSAASVDIVGIELSAENNQQKTTSFLYMGAALVSVVGGIVLLKSKHS